MSAEVPAPKDTFVVDMEVYLHETAPALLPYCEMPWRISVQSLAEMPENHLDILGPMGGYDHALWAETPPRRAPEDPSEFRREMDIAGVNLALLFPDSLIRISAFARAEYAAALTRAYNSWLTETWCRPDEGLLGCLLACPQDPADAAGQIRSYCDHSGVAAVCLPSWGIERAWGHRRYDPIFEAAESTGLPVILHTGHTGVWPTFPYNTNGLATDFARESVTPGFAAMSNLVDMVTTGVPVRYPRLRIGVVGSGVAWVPFLAQHLDKEYQELRREVPFITERPSRIVRRWTYTSHPLEEPRQPEEYGALLDLFDGPRNVVFGSGWPHSNADSPSRILELPLSTEVQHDILSRNALRFLNMNEKGARL